MIYEEYTFQSYLTGSFDYEFYKNLLEYALLSVIMSNAAWVMLVENISERRAILYMVAFVLITISILTLDKKALLMGNQHVYSGINRTDLILIEPFGIFNKMTVINNVYSQCGNIVAKYNYTAIYLITNYEPKNTTMSVKYLNWTLDYPEWSYSYIMMQNINFAMALLICTFYILSFCY